MAPERRAAFQAAWDRFLTLDLKDYERRAIGKELLARWTEVDLEGALAMALDADRQAGPVYGGGYLTSFDKLIIEHPENFLPVFQSKSFGLQTALVRNQWTKVLAEKEPMALQTHLDALSPKAKAQALAQILKSPAMTPGQMDTVLTSLAIRPDTPDNQRLWATAASAMAKLGTEELTARLAAATTPGERELAKTGLAAAVGASSREDAANALSTFSPQTRKDVAAAILATSDAKAPGILAAADALAASGDWEPLQSILPGKMAALSRSGQLRDDVTNWAIDLPEKPETEELYRSSLRAYLQNRPTASRQWIESMPSGWKRDNALAEYVNSSLNGNRDAAAANWALGQIQDDHFRKMAQETQTKWEQQRSK